MPISFPKFLELIFPVFLLNFQIFFEFKFGILLFFVRDEIVTIKTPWKLLKKRRL